MAYQVKINGDGSYTILNNGSPVQNAKVIRVSFPEVTSHTLEGAVHHIAGSGTADIKLSNGSIIKDVPLA